MSGTHAETARQQADVQRADAEGRKPDLPPGHVEAENPAFRRLGGRETRALAPVLGAGLVVIALVAGLVIWAL